MYIQGQNQGDFVIMLSVVHPQATNELGSFPYTRSSRATATETSAPLGGNTSSTVSSRK